jgi:Holliday junction resolvase RusA-like endonuclease
MLVPSVNKWLAPRKGGNGYYQPAEITNFKDFVELKVKTLAENRDFGTGQKDLLFFVRVYAVKSYCRRDTSNMIKFIEDAVYKGFGLNDNRNRAVLIELKKADGENEVIEFSIIKANINAGKYADAFITGVGEIEEIR